MDTVKTDRQKNFAFFEKNLQSWLKDDNYCHKYVVIDNCELKKAFDEFEQAVQYASSNFCLGKFIVQHVIDESEKVNAILGY